MSSIFSFYKAMATETVVRITLSLSNIPTCLQRSKSQISWTPFPRGAFLTLVHNTEQVRKKAVPSPSHQLTYRTRWIQTIGKNLIQLDLRLQGSRIRSGGYLTMPESIGGFTQLVFSARTDVYFLEVLAGITSFEVILDQEHTLSLSLVCRASHSSLGRN